MGLDNIQKESDFMKRCLIVMLCIIMCSSLVLADTGTSKDMENALLAVKQKVDVPSDLTSFYPASRDEQGRTSYSFVWQNEDGTKSLEITSDAQGRIQRYYFFDNSLKSTKKLTKLSKDDILGFAGEFIQKTIPETLKKSDTLVYEKDSWTVENLSYTLAYKRMREGIEVKNNGLTLRIGVCDDIAYVKSMNLTYDYDCEFEDSTIELESFEKAYRSVFPEELIYKDEYSAKGDRSTVLVYRFKDSEAGYILASTGEKAVEDTDDIYFDSADKEAAGNGAMRDDVLSEKERQELEKVEGLIGQAEAEKILKGLPYVKFEDSLIKESYDIYVRNKSYVVSVGYRNADGDRYLSASFDGKTGRILSLYNKVPYTESAKDSPDETKKNDAVKKMDEFLGVAASGTLSEFRENPLQTSGVRINRDFDREVNGIRYINDGINVSFDTSYDMITSFNLDYDEGAVFASPHGIATEDEAYEELLSIAPIKKEYMKTNGIFRVCYTLSVRLPEIDAFTKERYPLESTDNKDYNYTDIDGHWAEEKIEKLAEIQIGYEGETLRPDDEATQYDLLRLFAAGIRYRYYLDYDEDNLYSILESENVISKDEKSPQSPVTREDAFMFMVRLDGLSKVAELDGIFKVDYIDCEDISKDKIGSAAILTGMGIISGDGSALRPKDNITRAEVMVMIYNYMAR